MITVSTRCHDQPDSPHCNNSYTDLEISLLASWKAYEQIPEWVYKSAPVIAYYVGVGANMLLLLYLFKSGRCKVPIFTLLTSLALCDMLTCFGTATIAEFAFPEVEISVGGDAVCKMFVYLLTASYISSMCHLLFLAGLRYYQLVFPLKAKVQVTTEWVVKCCVAMWLISSLLTIPYPVFYIVSGIRYKDTVVYLFHFIGNYEMKELFILIFSEVGPLILISLLHLLKMYKVSRNAELGQQEKRSSSSRTVTLIMVLFIFSLIPRLVHTFYHGALGFPLQSFHWTLFMFTTHFSHMNSIADAFVYMLASAEIRKDMIKTFCGGNGNDKK